MDRRLIFLLLHAAVRCSFGDYSFTIEWTGRQKRHAGDTLTSVGRIPVLVVCKGKLLDKTVSNKNGVFILRFNDDGEKPFRPLFFYCIPRNHSI